MIASVMAALLGTTALADTSSMSTTATGMGVLENDYVKAGVNGTTGTLGSGGNTSPGLLYDSTGSGTFNTSYDYLTPGSPFDGFSIKIDDVNSTNNNNGNTAAWTDSDGLTNGTNSLVWTGTNTAHSGWEIENTYTLGATAEHIEIGTQITAGSDATALSFGRFIDPDARAATGDSSSTDNVLGYGVIPDTNVAFSEALSSRYALGLYSTDSNVDAGITGWSTDADSYTENAFDSDSNTNTGDNTIGLSWNWSSVSTGDILTASYAYIFGPSAFDAADAAITAGAGGGADISSWGTLEDVGSATDAADGAAEPTVTSTSDPVISYGTWGAWAHDTDLPVLSQAQTTHESSVADGVQTIDRETTTVVTTPQERSRTSTTTVVDTYSDGSTVTRTTATGTDTETRNNAVSTVTDPGAFTARMDTGKKIGHAVDLHSLGFADYVAGARITSDLGHGCSAESRVLGIGGSTTTDDLITIEGGINRITTNADACSTGDMTTLHMGVGASKALDEYTVRGTINRASQDITYERHIGTFTNQGEYAISDTWVNVEVEPNTGQVRPVLGIVAGKRSTDAYTETGSVQSAIAHEAIDESYRYATLGANFDLDFGTAHISRTTEGTTNIGIGIDKHVTENVKFVGDFQRSINDNASSNMLSVGLKIQF